MFDLKEFIVRNIVSGIKNHSFAKEYGNIMAVNYLSKGLLVEEDLQKIDEEITAWEAEKLAEEERKKQEAMNTPVVIPEIVDEEGIEPDVPVEEETETITPEDAVVETEEEEITPEDVVE